jgi:hypothetical protein
VESSGARCNIGVFNGWKRAAEVEIDLYDGSGTLLTTVVREIPAEQTVQLDRPYWIHAGRRDISSGYAVVKVGFGQHLLAYASVVDNGTNDPTTIPARSANGAVRQWIAAAAHAAGANGSQWRTDLAVLNLSGDSTGVKVIFYDDDGDTRDLSLAIGDGEQLRLDDAVAGLGTSGTGAIEIVSERPVMACSRTYNTSPEGTFGQILDGVEPSSAAATGEQRWLSQLQQNDRFRTNIGLVNISTETTMARVRLHDAAGNQLAAPSYQLDPGQRLQLQEPLRRATGRDDIVAGYAVVEVIAGSGLICYASVVDNGTNDPTTIPARR